MATITKVILSGSVNGLPIVCTGGTASANAVDVHDAGAGTSNLDEVWLWATNISTTTTVRLVIEFGAGAAVAGNIVHMINPSETVAVVPGIPICNGKEIEAYASVVDVVNVFGFVNRITA